MPVMEGTPFSTPKRKHAELLDESMPDINPAAQFTFEFRSPLKDDGSGSPRSSVAHRFRGLAIECGGGAAGNGSRASSSPEPRSMRSIFPFMHDEAHSGARKRLKPDTAMTDTDTTQLQLPVAPGDRSVAPSLPTSELSAPGSRDRKSRSLSPRQAKSPKSTKFALDAAVVVQSETLANTKPGFSPKHPQTASLPPGMVSEGDSKHPRGVRIGTPPVQNDTGKKKTDSSEDTIITDPLRASLTWHDHEITIYDPDDSDDDGTGINGIGFKPTPAIAYARTVKRKQQLAEYRKREEREARAKRNQRRRGSPVPGLVELKGSVERRRVRFMESATELISF